MEDKAREKAKARSGRGFNWFAILLAAIVAYGGWILADQQMTMGALDDDMAAARERLQAARLPGDQDGSRPSQFSAPGSVRQGQA